MGLRFFLLCPVGQFHTGEVDRFYRWGRFTSRWAGCLRRYRPNITGGDWLAMFCRLAFLLGLGRRRLGFLLFFCPVPLIEPLRQKGILLRSCANYAGLHEGWYRIAIRTHEENLQLIQALREVLS